MPGPHRAPYHRRHLTLAGLLLAAWLATIQRAPAEDWAVGPLFQTFPLTLEPGEGTEALGPLFYDYEGENQSLWAVPPLISSGRSPDGEVRQVFVLPPLFSWRRYGEDTRWQLGQWINASRMNRIEDDNVRRFNLFPLWFYQDSPDPAKDYWALFPLYGNLRNRLFRDEAEFVLFPVWLKTRKGTMTTRNIAFPFVHFRDGPGLSGWQFWPLAGHEHLEPTVRTNLSDEIETIPGHDKTFALWPIYFRNRLGLGTDNPGQVDAAIPFFYRERSVLRDHTSLLWPLISWTDDREQQFHQWNAPWPLVGFAHGEGKTLKRVLPFFSVGHNRELTSKTYLWPVYRNRRLQTEALDRNRHQVAVFLYSDTRERNRETGQTARRIDSWPLFSWSQNPEGQKRLQVLSIIEPIRRGVGLERNWSPLYSIWRQEEDPKTGARSQSLLWNLYRRDARPGSTKGSLLFGLVQYHKTPAGRRWRLFHLGPRLDPEAESTVSTNDVSEHR